MAVERRGRRRGSFIAVAVLVACTGLADSAAGQVDSNVYWGWNFGWGRGGGWGYLPQPRYGSTGVGISSQWGEQAQATSPISTSPLSPSAPGMSPQYRPGFQGLQAVVPRYPTFPTYPRGWGPAPRVGGFLPTELPTPGIGWQPEDALPESERRGWPSWIKEEIGDDVRAATPERAILARNADRIWFLSADETAFTPLAYYDKFRLVESGAVIEVRNKGEYQLVFHDGAQLRSVGACRVAVPRLAAEVAELQVRSFRRIWLSARTRPFRLLLPDGSSLEVESSQVYLERQGSRGFLHNDGPLPVQWKGRVGTVEIAPSRRIDLLLEPARKPYLSASLEVDGSVDVVRKGRMIQVTGTGRNGGYVTWSGTRIRVARGETLELDALAGTEFPEDGR